MKLQITIDLEETLHPNEMQVVLPVITEALAMRCLAYFGENPSSPSNCAGRKLESSLRIGTSDARLIE